MRLGVLAPYPPTLGGVAIFTRNLVEAFEASSDSECIVVRALPPHDAARPDRARAELSPGDRESQRTAVRVLNTCDVAIIEYDADGYGGADGEDAVVIARNLRVPLILTLHTLPVAPGAHRRGVVRLLADAADSVVVLTHAVRRIATESYGLPATKVAVVPHGSPFSPQAPQRIMPNRILTWGLLGPDKGVEWMIRALPALRDLLPRVEYHVAGELHPKVRQHSGTSYRTMLEREAERLGVADRLVLEPGHHTDRNLLRLVGTAALVVLPYETRDRTTSGVLVDALAAGRAVVATRFPHAIEALATGGGVTVPHHDPDALAAAVRHLLTSHAELSAATLAAARAGQHLVWREVVRSYRALVRQVASHPRRDPSLRFPGYRR